MPRSDDAYDLVHTYDQGKAGKSKTSRPAVRELGREGAATETILMEETGEPRTPPTGVRFLFYDQTGTLTQKNPDGSVEAIQTTAGAPADAEYVTTATDGDLSAESLHSGLSGSDLHDPATHGSTHQDGAADQLQVDTLAGDNGSAGQVLQTDGSSLSFGSVGGNAPDWTQDGNSPLTAQNTDSERYTLDGTFDRLSIFVDVTNQTSSATNMDLRINRDAGNNYDYLTAGGTRTTGDTKIPKIDTLRASQSTNFRLHMTGRFSEALKGGVDYHEASLSSVQGFRNDGITSPVDSFTIKAGRDLKLAIDVYGFDIGSGGVP